MATQVLVTYASKMGGTAEIAEAIGREIRTNGLEVDVLPARVVHTLNSYEYVVVGSAIYTGHWLRDAARLLLRYRRELSTRRVWLFQSGLPVTGPVKDPTPADVHDPAELVGAGHPITFLAASPAQPPAASSPV